MIEVIVALANGDIFQPKVFRSREAARRYCHEVVNKYSIGSIEVRYYKEGRLEEIRRIQRQNWEV